MIWVAPFRALFASRFGRPQKEVGGGSPHQGLLNLIGGLNREREEMKKRLFLILAMLASIALGACQSSRVHTFAGTSSVPDQTYDVTVFSGPTGGSFAVLFDVPHDGIEVFMKPGSFIKKTGLDSPQNYLDEFEGRIKGHRTLTISDQDGTVRAYLMVSNLLNYVVTSDETRIMVSIEDPYHGYYQSGP